MPVTVVYHHIFRTVSYRW